MVGVIELVDKSIHSVKEAFFYYKKEEKLKISFSLFALRY